MKRFLAATFIFFSIIVLDKYIFINPSWLDIVSVGYVSVLLPVSVGGYTVSLVEAFPLFL